MGGTPSLWNDQRIETLKTMAPQGFSAEQIARAISGPNERFSRSAVLGKAHRLRLPLTGKPTRPKREPKPAAPLRPRSDPDAPPQRGRPRKYVSEQPTPAATRHEPLVFYSAKPPSKPVSLQLNCEQLTDQTCKYPYCDVGDPGFGFCGQATYGRSSYCEYHARRTLAVVVVREPRGRA